MRAASAGADEGAIARSGGLDSSAVAATVARQGRVRRIVGNTTVTSGDAEAPVGRQRYRDERGKVTALGRMYPALELNFLAAAEAHPFDVEPARYFAQAQLPRRSGLNLGLVGTLTDALAQHPLALFGSLGNLGLSWSGRFALLARLRAGEIAGFARDLPRVLRRDPRGARDVLLSDVVAPAMPASLRRVARRLRGRRADGEAPDGVLNPEFIATHDLPRLWDMQQFGPGFRIDGWNPKRYRAWAMFDRAGVDRDNTGWAMRSHGVEVRDPFADRRLLEFALAVPEPLYRRDGIPRSFARAVFADRLPPEILHETRRGAGNLDWFGKAGRQRPLWAAEIERLEASATARRLLDLPRLKRLVADWPRHTGPNPRALHERDLLDRAMHVGGFIRWVEGGNA